MEIKSKALASQLSPFEQKKISMGAAVLWKTVSGEDPSNANPRVVVSSSSINWPKSVASGDQKVNPAGVKEHAERKIIMWALENGYNVYAAAASRIVCDVCASALFAAECKHIRPI